MSHHYSDPADESDPGSLPNIEVFEAKKGDWYRGEDGNRYIKDDLADHLVQLLNQNETIGETFTPCESGWYWWACYPGCMPESEANGPFGTEQDAVRDAQSQSED